MTVTALLISLSLHAQALDKPSVQYYQQEFTVRSQGVTAKVLIQDPEDRAPEYVAFRKNDAFAVWDSRGLTIRKGQKASSSRLPDIAVSPHAFTRAEILKNIDRIRSGDYTKPATALSGAKRIGKDAFFLLRWEDKSGKPWSEALVQVDLTADDPQPHLLGRFEGLSLATKSIDDKLQVLHGHLAVVARVDKSWGLSTYDPESGKFHFQAMGAALQSFDALNTTQGLFTETSAYGTHIAGRVDLEIGTRKILYEGREKVRFVDLLTPEIVLAFSTAKTKVIDCATGCIRTFPTVVQAKRVGKEILLWAPKGDPDLAWLLEPETWTTLATWRTHGSG